MPAAHAGEANTAPWWYYTLRYPRHPKLLAVGQSLATTALELPGDRAARRGGSVARNRDEAEQVSMAVVACNLHESGFDTTFLVDLGHVLI